jgi:NAD(P)-dependent dehydrogenase (short-subunit alcohol dehydrogenase family)
MRSNQLLEGRSIIVTGGANGIGRAVALRSAQAGAAVTVTDVSVADGEAVVSAIRASGGRAQFIRVDVVDEDQVRASISAAMSAFGHVDGACNAAGMPFMGVPMDEIPVDFWERVHAVNLRGLFLSMKYQAKAMLTGRGGSIVNIASTAGVAGIPNGSEYCSSKAGVIGATRAAAIDYARRGIRVNAVLPGATRTQMMQQVFDRTEGMEAVVVEHSPMGRLGEPDEIAFAVRWLLSAESSFVTGVALPVDGGLTGSL